MLPFTGRPLLTGPWLLNSITLTAFTAGDQTKMDRSFPSCTTEHVHQQRQNGCFRDGIQRSNGVWICCCSLMKSWLIMFILHIICTRPIGRLVSQFYSSLGCFYPSGTTGRVVNSNTDVAAYPATVWMNDVAAYPATAWMNELLWIARVTASTWHHEVDITILLLVWKAAWWQSNTMLSGCGDFYFPACVQGVPN